MAKAKHEGTSGSPDPLKDKKLESVTVPEKTEGVEPPINADSLKLLARVKGTSVSPAFALFREPTTGLVVFVPKEISDASIDPSVALMSNSFSDIDAFIRNFTLAHSREVFPE